jgi:phosphoserine phosphatase
MNAESLTRPAGVVFFDIDGTLVVGTSSGQFLAQRLGHLSALRSAESAYAAGAMDNAEVCQVDARGWAGFREAEVATWLTDLPLIDGIEETVAWCQDHHLVPIVASLAWTAVGSYLASEFGFAGYCGPRLGVDAGAYTGVVAETFDEFAKRDFAAQAADNLGLSPAACVAIGDSRSDLPLFDSVGLSIALNPTPDARAAAHHAVASQSLTAVLPFIDAWMSPAS